VTDSRQAIFVNRVRRYFVEIILSGENDSEISSIIFVAQMSCMYSALDSICLIIYRI